MKVGRDPAADPRRVAAARRAIGDRAELLVDGNGAYARKGALAAAEAFADAGVTWFEEPVSSDDPALAPETIRRWFRRRGGPRGAGRRVILWPDTFHEHFRPETARAAVEVLEAAGFRVEVPERPLCCGRPLYDIGMLDRAKRQLREVLDALREPIRAGVPVVGLEPSCVSTFRDELPNLFPGDEDARRLAEQTVLLAELLERHEGWTPPRLERRAIVHGHCHQKAILGMGADLRVLERIGVEAELLDSGAAGWPGRSATSGRSSRCRCRPASRCSSRPSGRRTGRPWSSPTASPAASRSSTGPSAGRSTWPRSSGWRWGARGGPRPRRPAGRAWGGAIVLVVLLLAAAAAAWLLLGR